VHALRDLYAPPGFYVDGGWKPAGGGPLQVVSPATEDLLFSYVGASEADVDRAVRSARRAFDEGPWPRFALDERIAILEHALELVRPRRNEFALMTTLQMGAPITAARMLIDSGLAGFGLYLGAARGIGLEKVRRDTDAQALVRKEPVGVVAAIMAWNGTFGAAITKLVPPLLAGCTVVAKPAPETPCEASLLVALFSEAGVPPGAVNLVTGGRDTGAALVTHPEVDKIAFTGSTATGRWIADTCAPRFTRMSLELGGKSAAIVLPDVDVAQAVPQIAMGNFWNAGQACIAPTRVLVPRELQDELVAGFCDEAAKLIVGDPLDEATQMGPLVTRRQRDRVERYIELGRQEGATVAFGGGRPEGLRCGWFVEPTVFTGVDNSMTIAREEIFGPVMSVITYGTEAEAVEIANDSEYGLHGCVFTRDTHHGLDVAKRIQSGSVSINSFGLSPSAPYGGVKASGVGREKGVEGIESYFELKSYILPPELADDLEASGVPQG
jgi:acyl-CoA reductase-like NAD-dependent aldehyde dehydrogenase